MDKKFYDKINAQVQGLGQTPSAIAESLRIEGIKAVPGQASRCALSKFVKKHYPEVIVFTTVDSVHFYDPDSDWSSVPFYHSPALREFVAGFDKLQYPELVDYERSMHNLRHG